MIEESYDFDDVLIKPVPSTVSSRDDVDISVKLSDKLTLKFPLIASPMVGVVDGAFAKKLSDLGGLAILHRFYKKGGLFADLLTNLRDSDCHFGISIKVGETIPDDIVYQFEPDILLIDTANGYTEKLWEYCESVKNYIVHKNLNTLLMAGNVVSYDGCLGLYNAGCDIIRVGIGGGSLCSTRNQTGVGIPNISAIIDCLPQSESYKIVIDGGIRYPGDLVKAIVAGADLGMSGRLFAECYESPNDGMIYGMASRTHMENTKVDIKSVEGFDMPVTKKYSLEQFVREFGYGMKSAGTYLNARSLSEIHANGQFIKVGDSAIKKGI